MKTNISDSELLQAILEKKAWTHQTLAYHLRFHRTQISRILQGRQFLRPLTREKAEELLAEAEQQQNNNQ